MCLKNYKNKQTKNTKFVVIICAEMEECCTTLYEINPYLDYIQR